MKSDSIRRTFSTIEITDADLAVGGRFEATVMSPALDRRADCTFWFPESPLHTSSPLPLVVLLHGVYGSHWAWIGRGAADVTAAALIETGTIPPCVLAMPSDGLIGHGSSYLTHPHADVPNWILDEVPILAANVASTTNAQVDPDRSIGLVGLSMGGFGALHLGVTRPDRVAAAAGMSSITSLDDLAIFGATPPDPLARPWDHSVIAAVRAHGERPTPLPPLHLDCGTDDVLIEQNRALHRDLTAAGVPHEWIERPGRHEWAYWRRHLGEVLAWICPHLV